jgi:excisionase family DNA binding protein
MPTSDTDHDRLIPFAERLEEQQAGDLAKLLTIREAAAHLAISDRSLWTIMQQGHIRCVRIGRSLRFDPADLRRYIERNKTGGQQQ